MNFANLLHCNYSVKRRCCQLHFLLVFGLSFVQMYYVSFSHRSFNSFKSTAAINEYRDIVSGCGKITYNKQTQVFSIELTSAGITYMTTEVTGKLNTFLKVLRVFPSENFYMEILNSEWKIGYSLGNITYILVHVRVL